MKRHTFLLLVFLIALPFSCKHPMKDKDTFVPLFPSRDSVSINKTDSASKDEIYYGILTPVEICSIFNRLGVPHNSDILNPVSNKDLYFGISKISINTGVYGADFTYLKLFGVDQKLIDYMVAIREMSDRLGIPDSFVTEPIKRIQNDISIPDTILILMSDAYNKMENYLRAGERGSTAGLMIMGGWIETMYIATQLAYNPEKPDQEVIRKIAEQKYTLTTLLNYLKNYYDDPSVVYYSKKLKYLKSYFDTFDIYFRKGDLEIDTVKKVFRSTGSEMNVTVENLNNIRDYVSKLRTEIVTP